MAAGVVGACDTSTGAVGATVGAAVTATAVFAPPADVSATTEVFSDAAQPDISRAAAAAVTAIFLSARTTNLRSLDLKALPDNSATFPIQRLHSFASRGIRFKLVQ